MAAGADLECEFPLRDPRPFRGCLIVGAPGSGKSYICSDAYWCAWDSYVNGRARAIPLFFNLEYSDLGHIESTIARLQSAVAKGVDQRPRIHLFLDTLDQARAREKVVKLVTHLRATVRHLEFTLFSREVSGLEPLADVLRGLRVQPLTNRQVERIVWSETMTQADRVLVSSMMESGFFEALRTPLVARLFAMMRENEQRFPTDFNDNILFELIGALDERASALLSDDEREAKRNIERELSRRSLKGEVAEMPRSGLPVFGARTPFLNESVEMVRFRHDLFRDYFDAKAAASSVGKYSLLRLVFRDSGRRNLSFFVFALPENQCQELLGVLTPIVRWSVKYAVLFTGKRNPFLLLYIKILVRFSGSTWVERLMETLLDWLKRDRYYFVSTFDIGQEIHGRIYEDFRIQNFHFLLSQVRSLAYLKHLREVNDKKLSRYSIFGFLGYRSAENAEFLIDRLDAAAEEDGILAHYVVSILSRFPISVFPGLLQDRLTGKEGKTTQNALRVISHLFSSTDAFPNLSGRSGDEVAESGSMGNASSLGFDDVSRRRILDSEAWVEFLYTAFIDGDDEVSDAAMLCLRSLERHKEFGFGRRIIELCRSQDRALRVRAIKAAMYFSYVSDELRAILEELLQSGDDPHMRYFALTVAQLVDYDLFNEWAGPVLLTFSQSWRLPTEKNAQFQQDCTDTIRSLGLAFDDEATVKVATCLSIAVNAPKESMRGWGLELLAEHSDKLAVRTGEWLYREDGESIEVLRALSNVAASKSTELVAAALRSDDPFKIALGINCVDEHNFNDELSSILTSTKATLPGGWRHLEKVIDEIIANKGRPS